MQGCCQQKRYWKENFWDILVHQVANCKTVIIPFCVFRFCYTSVVLALVFWTILSCGLCVTFSRNTVSFPHPVVFFYLVHCIVCSTLFSYNLHFPGWKKCLNILCFCFGYKTCFDVINTLNIFLELMLKYWLQSDICFLCFRKYVGTSLSEWNLGY